MNRESQNFHIMIKQGITWYNLETEINSINLQIFHFRYGMPTPTRVQFPAQILQMQTPSRGGRCRGENCIDVGDAYLLEETG